MTRDRLSRAEAYARGSVKLASPPKVFTRLMSALDDPWVGPQQLANVLSEDQALTARLLVIVNSAFYALPWRVDSISEAVRVIGTAQIRDLAIGTSILRTFEGVEMDHITVDSLRRHSLGVGVLARAIAAHAGEANTERFFIAGLIHDIGRLVLAEQSGADLGHAIAEAEASGRDLRAVELEHLGCTHVQVGGALLDGWNFPRALREVVRFHHQPQRAQGFPVEAAAVHVADATAHALEWGRSGQAAVPDLDPWASGVLGLSPESIRKVIDDATVVFEAAEGWLTEEVVH